MKKNGFAPILIILIILVLGVVGYFAYKNYLVKQQLSVIPSSSNIADQNNQTAMLKQSGFTFELPDKEWKLETQKNGDKYDYSIEVPNPNYDPSNTKTYQDKLYVPIQFYVGMPWAKTEADLYPDADFKIISQETFQSKHNVKIHLYNLQFIVNNTGPSMFVFGQNLDMAFFQAANGDYIQVYSSDHSMNNKFKSLLQSVTISQ